jgi:membrane associated rhomboid family serine protease
MGTTSFPLRTHNVRAAAVVVNLPVPRVLHRMRRRPARAVRLARDPNACIAMELDTPDPTFTNTERARANFRLAVRLALGFVAFLWFVHLTNWATDVSPASLGVRPRDPRGLVGILAAPLLHVDFAHLVANSPALVVLGAALLYLYPSSAFKVLAAVYVGSGVAVWLLASGGGVHVGASGLVYGLASYILVAGLLRRDRRAIAASLLVFFLYGTLVWGVLPIRHGVSWETHLAAALIGAAMACLYRRSDVPPPVRYSWEQEPEPAGDEPPRPGASRDDG